MSNRTNSAKGRSKPSRSESSHVVDPDNIPPLALLRDCYSSRSVGKIGYLPYSENALRQRVRDGRIKVVSLGPRLQCLDRNTIQHIQKHGLPA
jgi:hypothetical protein